MRDAGHDADLWPRLMTPLAEAWGKDALILKRRLALSYTGPASRTGHPAGEDVPRPPRQGFAHVQGLEEMVVAGFRLSGRKVKFIFDDHETQLPGHPRAVEASSRPPALRTTR